VQQSVLIVDDHGAFRRAARAMLESDGFRVVGAACDGAEAIAMAGRLKPDIVLLDIQLTDVSGFAVADELGRWPAAPIVVLTSSRDASVYRAQLATRPSLGFLAKADLSREAIARLVG
jgi:DNA-binding NarL/FixJ family response regulator